MSPLIKGRAQSKSEVYMQTLHAGTLKSIFPSLVLVDEAGRAQRENKENKEQF